MVTVKLEAASFLVCEGFVVKRSALNTLKLTQRRFARRVDERSFSYTHGLVLSDQTEFGGIGLAVQRRVRQSQNSRGHRSSLNSRVATHEEENFECHEEENLAISTLLSLLA